MRLQQSILRQSIFRDRHRGWQGARELREHQGREAEQRPSQMRRRLRTSVERRRDLQKQRLERVSYQSTLQYDENYI